MSNSKSSSGGIGICGATFIVFLILKLTETGAVAKWSWWWVTSPLWIPVCIFLGILIIYLAFISVGAFTKKKKYEKQFRIRKSTFQQKLEQKINDNKK